MLFWNNVTYRNETFYLRAGPSQFDLKKCLQYCVILIKSIFTLQVPAANVPLKTFAVFSHSFIAVDDTTAVQELSPDDLGVLLLQIMM